MRSGERKEEGKKKSFFVPCFPSLPSLSLSLSFSSPLFLSLSLSHTNARLRLEEEEQERAISLNLRNSSSILLILFLLRLFFRSLLCHRLPLLLPPRLLPPLLLLVVERPLPLPFGQGRQLLDDGGAPGVGEGCGGERDRGERVLFGFFFRQKESKRDEKSRNRRTKKSSLSSFSHRLQPRDDGPHAARQQRRDEPVRRRRNRR